MSHEENLRKARARYDKKRVKLSVSFNLGNERDIELHAFAKNVLFSAWVKDRIEDEIRQRKKESPK